MMIIDHGVLIPLLTFWPIFLPGGDDGFPLERGWNVEMIEIAGGILLAVAVLAMVVATFRYIVLALSAAFCIAVAAGVWLLISRDVGGWWAAALLFVGFAVWFLMVNYDRHAEMIREGSPQEFAQTSATSGQDCRQSAAPFSTDDVNAPRRMAQRTYGTSEDDRVNVDPAWWAD